MSRRVSRLHCKDRDQIVEEQWVTWSDSVLDLPTTDLEQTSEKLLNFKHVPWL